MQTRNLTKADYYKSRNIAIPKPLPKLNPQPPVRLHLLEPMPSLAIEIRRHIESKKNKEIRQLEHMGYEPTFLELQVKHQDLTKLLANRQDEIMSLKNEKEKDERKITLLDKEVFDLKAQIQRLDYEYKTTIQYLKVENITQRNEFQERLVYLEKQASNSKQHYTKLLQETKQTYDLRIQTYSGSKETHKIVSEELVNGLKENNEFHIAENKRLRNELILSEKEVFEKIKHFEQQNFVLRQKLEHQEIEFSLSVMKTNTEVQLRDTRIQQLNDQINQMVKTFESEKEKFLFEKDYVERAKNDKENRLKENLQNLLCQKEQMQVELCQALSQCNELKNSNYQLQKKLNQISTQISFLEFEKEESLSKFKIKIEQAKENQKYQFQNDIQSLKKTYEQKIILIQKNFEDKSNEIFFLNQRFSKLTDEIDEKELKIKDLEQKQATYQAQRKSILQVNEQLFKEIKTLQKELELAKIDFDDQKTSLLNRFNEESQSKLVQVAKQSKDTIICLRQQIKDIKASYEDEIKSLTKQMQKNQTQMNVLLQENEAIKTEKQCLELKHDSLNFHSEKTEAQNKKQVLELKQLIEEREQNLKKKIIDCQSLQDDLKLLRHQIDLKVVQIEKLEKDLKQSRLDNDQIKLQTIRKCSGFSQKMQETLFKYDSERNDLVLNLKKAENEITNLRVKIQHNSSTINNLQSEKEVYISENERLKEALTKRQENANQLLNELNLERKQLAEKISSDFKQKIITLQQKNQTLLLETNRLNQKNLQLLQTIQQQKNQKSDLQKKLLQRIVQIAQYNQQIAKQRNQIPVLEKKLLQSEKIRKNIENQKKKLQDQRQKIRNKLESFANDTVDLKKTKTNENDSIQQLEERVNRFLVIFEEQKMDVNYQKQQKGFFERLFEERRQQLSVAESQLADLRQKMLNIKETIQKEITEVKMKDLEEQFKLKNHKLLEKIDILEKNITQKDAEITKITEALTRKQYAIEDLQVEYQRLEQVQTKHKGCIEHITKLEAVCHANAITIKNQRQNINDVKEKLKHLETSKTASIKQKQLRINELQSNLIVMIEKYQNEVKKNEDADENISLQITKLKTYIVKQDNQIQSLNDQLKELEKSKEVNRQTIVNHYEATLIKLKIEHQAKMSTLYADSKIIIDGFRIKESEANQKNKKLRADLTTLKVKMDTEISKKDQQILSLSQEIKTLERKFETLYKYKQIWQKISGQVKCLDDNIDLHQASQLDRSYSMKASVVIDTQFIPRIERNELINANKLFFSPPEMQEKIETIETEETQKKEKIETEKTEVTQKKETKLLYEKFAKTERSNRSEKMENNQKSPQKNEQSEQK